MRTRIKVLKKLSLRRVALMHGAKIDDLGNISWPPYYAFLGDNRIRLFPYISLGDVDSEGYGIEVNVFYTLYASARSTNIIESGNFVEFDDYPNGNKELHARLERLITKCAISKSTAKQMRKLLAHLGY